MKAWNGMLLGVGLVLATTVCAEETGGEGEALPNIGAIAAPDPSTAAPLPSPELSQRRAPPVSGPRALNRPWLRPEAPSLIADSDPPGKGGVAETHALGSTEAVHSYGLPEPVEVAGDAEPGGAMVVAEPSRNEKEAVLPQPIGQEPTDSRRDISEMSTIRGGTGGKETSLVEPLNNKAGQVLADPVVSGVDAAISIESGGAGHNPASSDALNTEVRGEVAPDELDAPTKVLQQRSVLETPVEPTLPPEKSATERNLEVDSPTAPATPLPENLEAIQPTEPVTEPPTEANDSSASVSAVPAGEPMPEERRGGAVAPTERELRATPTNATEVLNDSANEQGAAAPETTRSIDSVLPATQVVEPVTEVLAPDAGPKGEGEVAPELAKVSAPATMRPAQNVPPAMGLAVPSPSVVPAQTKEAGSPSLPIQQIGATPGHTAGQPEPVAATIPSTEQPLPAEEEIVPSDSETTAEVSSGGVRVREWTLLGELYFPATAANGRLSLSLSDIQRRSSYYEVWERVDFLPRKGTLGWLADKDGPKVRLTLWAIRCGRGMMARIVEGSDGVFGPRVEALRFYVPLPESAGAATVEMVCNEMRLRAEANGTAEVLESRRFKKKMKQTGLDAPPMILDAADFDEEDEPPQRR